MPPNLPLFFATNTPPRAEKRPHTTPCGPHLISDDYAWLRDENWRAVMHDPHVLAQDIRDHLLAENTYCDQAMADTSELQETLVAEMRGRIREDDADVPCEDGPFSYFTRYNAGAEHPLYVRQPIRPDGQPNGETEVLLDGEALSKGSDYFDLGEVMHSPDHRFLAYAVDRQGSEYYDIQIIELDSGIERPVSINNASADFVWSGDSASIFWIWRDDNNRPKEVRRHHLDEAIAPPKPLYREADEGFFLSLSCTRDRNFILIEANDHSTSEVRIIDAHNPDHSPVVIAPRSVGVEYHIDHAGDHFYILTNTDGAEDFKIVTAPDHTPTPEYWQDFIPASPGVRRLEQQLFKDYHVRLERADALPRIIVRRITDGSEYTIKIDGAAYALGLVPLLDFDTRRLRFASSSMAQPRQVFDFDMDSQNRTLRKTQEIPSGHNSADYCVERIFADTKDGETVPLSLVYRKGLKRDGSAPVLLYGYGSYGITMSAGFSAPRLSLLDRGFIYAIAHVRGSEAKGHGWYTAAKGAGKPKTFHDFIASAQTLIDLKYTSQGKIIAMGGSAGGLLVGAVLNMAPELFGGAIAAVPFVDVLNTMNDETLPLTPPEWPEWGNPAQDPEAYDVIRNYSPYDNVRTTAYPPLLVTAGLTDPRVTYWEPAKWVAKLRDRAPKAGPYLLKTEMQAGHGGLSGRFEGLKTTALEYAFAIKAAGIA